MTLAYRAYNVRPRSALLSGYGEKRERLPIFGLDNLRSQKIAWASLSWLVSLRKDAIALSRGAYSAGARSALMRIHIVHVLAFLVNPGALGLPQRNISGTSIKIIS